MIQKNAVTSSTKFKILGKNKTMNSDPPNGLHRLEASSRFDSHRNPGLPMGFPCRHSSTRILSSKHHRTWSPAPARIASHRIECYAFPAFSAFQSTSYSLWRPRWTRIRWRQHSPTSSGEKRAIPASGFPRASWYRRTDRLPVTCSKNSYS